VFSYTQPYHYFYLMITFFFGAHKSQTDNIICLCLFLLLFLLTQASEDGATLLAHTHQELKSCLQLLEKVKKKNKKKTAHSHA
jgi:hypothetical protein